MQLLELLTKYLNRTIVKTAEDTLVDTFGIFQRCSLDCLSSTTELADVRTQMVANLQILASEESVKRPGSPLEPLSATGLASCATERTDTIFDILSLSGKIKHRISWLRTQQNGMTILRTENLKQQCQKQRSQA